MFFDENSLSFFHRGKLDNMSSKNLVQLFEEFINECTYSRSLRPETIKGYKATFDHFTKMVPEVSTVQLLTVEMINEFFKRIKTRRRIVGRDTVRIGLEDSTIKTYGNKLNAFFVWLIQRNIIKENPLDNIKLRNPEYKDQRALEDNDTPKIYSAFALHSNGNSLLLRRDTAMVSLLYFLGLRLGEFISLRVTDVDMEKRLLTVRAETSKSKKSRYLPMHPTLVFHLQEYIKERNKRGYQTENLIVSSSRDRGLTRDGVKHWVNKIKKHTGIKFHMHRLRHTFACNLSKSNVDVVNIQKLMGHSDPRMTLLYLRSVKAEDLRDDINKLAI